MENGEVKIFDIMACNVYWDFENSPMPKETHKFLVALYPTPGIKAPELIDTITAYGPGGYEVKFANQMFDNDNKNGWFYDPRIPNYWYMINLPTGFMKEGEYTIEIKCKDGSIVKNPACRKTHPPRRWYLLILNTGMPSIIHSHRRKRNRCRKALR
jgi:hypothetical protein